jgi:hypothetical protein
MFTEISEEYLRLQGVKFLRPEDGDIHIEDSFLIAIYSWLGNISFLNYHNLSAVRNNLVKKFTLHVQDTLLSG